MLISIIILSWERKSEILKTLQDLKNQTYSDYELVIVDQGSEQDTIDSIRQLVPKAQLICLDTNIGVPAGRNIGAKKANGDILVFLDNDASLDNMALERVIDRFKREEKTGIIGFKIINANTNDLDISSWPYQKARLKDADKPFFTYIYSGGGHAIRKDVFEKTGYYWEDLFFSWEETDLSIKALDAGYGIVYDPTIIVYHRIAQDKKTHNPEHDCLRLRNSLWVLWRYMPLGYAIRQSFLRIAVYFIKAIRQRCFLNMFFSFLSSFKKIGELFNRKNKISARTLDRYMKLSDKGPVLGQLKDLLFDSYKKPR